MPPGKDPTVKKVKTTRPVEEEPDELEEEERPVRPPRPLRQEPKPKPWEDVQLAETRVAQPIDEGRQKDEDDPAERLGLSKIGPTKGVPLDALTKDDAPDGSSDEPIVPEPIIEEAIQEDESHEQPTESIEDEPEEPMPSGKLPPPPIPPGEKGKTVDPPKPPKEEEPAKVELEEIEVKQGGRTVKIMRVKHSAPPPPSDEEGDVDDDLAAAAFGIRARPGGPKSLMEPPTTDNIKKVPATEKENIPRPRKGERIRHSAGLGVDVELDEEAIRKLSAPVLPAEFNYPTRAFYSRFSRYVLFMILPVLVLFILYLLKQVTSLSILIVVMLVLVMLSLLIVYGVSPFYTSHWVTKDAVLLKHGYYFDAKIPLPDIKSVKLYEEKAGMLGIRVDRKRRLFALSDRKDMVGLDLKSPMRVGNFNNIETVITNVEAPTTFLRTVRSAISALNQDLDEPDDEAQREGPEVDTEDI